GRKTREQGAQYADYQNELVRPTTDFEYDSLGQVNREIDRGKDGATEADDRITLYTYDYGYGARLLGRQDPSGAVMIFAYDFQGTVASRWIQRNDADGEEVTDRISYVFDLLGREVQNIDGGGNQGTLQVKETRYNVYGEITGKRTYVGAAPGAAWQEIAEYDNAGRVWKNNSGDGIAKVYLYDA